MCHHESIDFVPDNRSLSAVEVGLVNVMSRETVLRQYVDSVKRNYDYVLLDLPSLAGDAGHQRSVLVRLCSCPRPGGLPDSGGHDGVCRHGAEHKGQINPKLKIGGTFFPR